VSVSLSTGLLRSKPSCQYPESYSSTPDGRQTKKMICILFVIVNSNSNLIHISYLRSMWLRHLVYGSWIEGTTSHHKVSEIVASRRKCVGKTYSAIQGTGFPRCFGRRQSEGRHCRRPSHSFSALCPIDSAGSPTHLLLVAMPRHIDQEGTRHIRPSYHLGIGQGCNWCSRLGPQHPDIYQPGRHRMQMKHQSQHTCRRHNPYKPRSMLLCTCPPHKLNMSSRLYQRACS
jgi:hypothetical protein